MNMKQLIRLMILIYCTLFFIQSITAKNRDGVRPLQNTTSCESFIDPSPLNRTSSFGEENVVNTNFEGVAQQYNNLTGSLTAMKFQGRANPSLNVSNVVKVIVYQVNIGLPGVILGQTTVTLDTSSVDYPVHAIFSSPITLSNNSIIISIEPQVPSTDNFFIQRNSPPDGGNLNLIKIKQAGQWFNNLAISGGPSYNYDFIILPITETNITASFTHSASGGSVAFTNTSNGGSGYLWDFGDGDTSTAFSPVHNYSTSNTYPVILKTFSNTNQCFDSAIQNLNVVTGIVQLQKSVNGQFKIISSQTDGNKLLIETPVNTHITVFDIIGREKLSLEIVAGRVNDINIEQLPSGIYLIKSPGMQTVRFMNSKQ